MAAFDTENKRRSALNTAIYRNLPIADGIIGLDDRAMMLYQYAHDSYPPPIILLEACITFRTEIRPKTFRTNIKPPVFRPDCGK